MSVSATAKNTAMAVPPPQTLEMQTNVCGDLQTLRLTGELDIVSAPLLEEALDAMRDGACAARLVLDLGDVTFLDSTGMRAILRVREFCASTGREFQVIRAGAQVERLFQITGLHNELF